MMKILRDGKINIYEYINKEQLEKLNPPEDLRTVIEKLGWQTVYQWLTLRISKPLLY